MSALHCGLGGYGVVDVRSLVHAAETSFYHQFSLQLGMELDLSV